jgi:HEAT repeat protein
MGGFMIWGGRQGLVAQRCRIGELEECGLTVERAFPIFSLIEGLRASDGVVQVAWEKSHLRMAIPGLAGFTEVAIRPEKPVVKWTREIELGAPEFDDTFFVQGPAQLVSALLDAEARRLMLAMNNRSQRLRVQHGAIETEMMEAELVTFLPQLLDLGHRFARTGDIRQKLAENARQDPEPGVRLNNLLLLVHELPEAPDSREALHHACLDPSPRVRLGAALELGPEARTLLLELAEETEDDGVSAQAIARLGGELPAQRARDLLSAALERRQLKTASACLTALAADGTAEVVAVLAAVLDRERGDLAAAAAQALGASGNPAAEPALIRALQREEDAVQVAAAQALSRVGTANAVPLLKEAAEHRGADLRRATRQAIAEIQSRLPGASEGQLSLAETEAGQLSIAEAEGGRLSIADPAGPRPAEPPLPPHP